MLQSKRVTILLVSIALLASQVFAQYEQYDFDVGTGRRSGKASLIVEPDLEKKRSTITFRTQQTGVSHTNKFRLAIQWIKNTADPAQSQWNSVVFQLRVPQGGGSEDPAIEKILTGTNYDRYVRQAAIWTNDEYVDLVLVDQDQQVTVDTTNNYRGAGDEINYKVTQSRVVVGQESLVEIKVSAPYLDPVGENLIWYKWSFFNEDGQCDDTRFENYCFTTSPIDGKKTGYLYTTYISWTDFYDKGEVMTFYWIVFAFSLFIVFGQPAQNFTCSSLQIYLLIKSIIGYTSALEHSNVEVYQGEITTLMLGTHFFTFSACSVMTFATAFPIFGPILNLSGLLLIETYIANIDVYTGSTATDETATT